MFILETRIRGAEATLAGLRRVSRLIQTGSSEAIGRRLSREGLRIVVKLTPRQRSLGRADSSKRGHAPFHAQWTIIEELARSSTYRAIIRNRATLNERGVVALASVELGAHAHRIPTHGLRKMVWNSSSRLFLFRRSDANRPTAERGSNVITDTFSRRARGARGVQGAFSVQHPGHQGFRMVEETRIILRGMTDILLHNFALEIQRVFGSGFQVSVR